MHTTPSIVDRILRQARVRLHVADLRPCCGVQLANVLRHVRDISGTYGQDRRRLVFISFNFSREIKNSKMRNTLSNISNLLLLCTQANVPISMRLIFFFHMVGSFIHIIVLTYICGGLIEESSNIGLATYSGWWTVLPMDEAGRMLREDVKVMIMKSMRPCYLSAGGFFPVSLETSTAVRDHQFPANIILK